MKASVLFISTVVLRLFLNSAAASTGCSFDHHHESGNLTTQETPMSGECNLFLAPIDTSKPYRSYLFKSDGMIQVGDTYNIPGKDTISTGTETFFVFPRSGNPSAEIVSVPGQKNGEVVQQVRVKLPSGDAVDFSTGQQSTPSSKRKLPQIANGEGGIDVLESSVITPASRGGVVIKPNVGSTSIVLDSGYTLGNKPAYLNANATSTFRDSADHSCPVSNSLLFKKTRYDAEFAFKDDATLFSFLRSHCPRDFQLPARQTGGTNRGAHPGSAGSLSSPE